MFNTQEENIMITKYLVLGQEPVQFFEQYENDELLEENDISDINTSIQEFSFETDEELQAFILGMNTVVSHGNFSFIEKDVVEKLNELELNM
jgi:hypothetical protein